MRGMSRWTTDGQQVDTGTIEGEGEMSFGFCAFALLAGFASFSVLLTRPSSTLSEWKGDFSFPRTTSTETTQLQEEGKSDATVAKIMLFFFSSFS